MLGVVICLLLAEERGWKWAVAAGLAGLLLGNIHSYDMIHLTAAWGAYLLARWIVGRRFPARELGLALLAAVVAAPSVAHLAWLYKTEPVFQARADTPTLSPRLALYLLGYGLLIPLALWGVAVLRRLPETDLGARPEAVRLRRLLPTAWLVAGFVAAYAPFAFQRKMIMGTHLPLALLAGLAVADLARRAAAITHRPRAAGVAAALLVGLLSITSVRFLYRDAAVALREGRTSTTVHPVFWPASDLKALEWLGAHAPPDAALLRDPFQGVLVPAYSGRAVYAGHWGETPRFSDRVKDVVAFYGRRWTSEERLRFLRENRITHVLEAAAERGLAEVGQRFDNSPPLAQEPFLRPVLQEGSTTLYEVVEPVAAPG
jgi:hypothetical protein